MQESMTNMVPSLFSPVFSAQASNSNNFESVQQSQPYDSLSGLPQDSACNILVSRQLGETQVYFNLLKEAEQMCEVDLRSQLSIFFPQVSQELSQLTEKQIRQFISQLIQNYESQRPFQMVVQHNYPQQKEMVKIIVDLLPEFQQDLPQMNNDELKRLFAEVFDQLKLTPLRIQYLVAHPFEVTLKVFRPYFISPTRQDLLLRIKKQKEKAELLPALPSCHRVLPQKRTFENMLSTNCKPLFEYEAQRDNVADQVDSVAGPAEDQVLLKRQICGNGFLKAKEAKRR